MKDLEQVISSQYRHINGIMIIKDGNVILEKYYNGYSAEDTHHVASVTKSIISALIGIAIHNGHIENIEQKVLDFFPEYQCKMSDVLKRSITIRHLLTMSAPSMLKSGPSGNEALDRLRRQKSWVPFILDQLGKGGQPGNFYYSTSNTHLLSAIISRTTGMSAREYANKQLFQPIGIKEIADHEIENYTLDNVFGKNLSGWPKDPQGITIGGWGLTISAADMVRFGYLYLNNGQWENKQIIPKKWIESSTIGDKDYGYLWWLLKDEKYPVYAALGSGGNGIWCIPENNMVISVTAKIQRRAPDTWDILKRFVL